MKNIEKMNSGGLNKTDIQFRFGILRQYLRARLGLT